MKRALISDIHSNLEGLEAVLADIDSKGIKEVYCLGDIVGYGPNPRECIDLVQKHCQICLLGNHDQGALFDPEGFHTVAERAIFWTREQLEQPLGMGDRPDQRWEFLGELPRTHREEPYLYVHGSARNPLNEYVFPEDVYMPRKLERIFALVQRFCFQGHTHVPGIFTERPEFIAPEDTASEYPLPSEGRLMVNVGSVGQPRDGDNRACYMIIEDDELLRFCRVPYDFEETRRKIYGIPDLDNNLGDRLRDGK